MNEPKEEKKYFGMDAKTCMKAMLEALTGKPVTIVEEKGEIIEDGLAEEEIIEEKEA